MLEFPQQPRQTQSLGAEKGAPDGTVSLHTALMGSEILLIKYRYPSCSHRMLHQSGLILHRIYIPSGRIMCGELVFSKAEASIAL